MVDSGWDGACAREIFATYQLHVATAVFPLNFLRCIVGLLSLNTAVNSCVSFKSVWVLQFVECKASHKPGDG